VDHEFLQIFEGADWLDMDEIIDRLAQADYWSADMMRAAQVHHVTTQIARLVDEDGVPLMARLRTERDGKRGWVYKRTDAFTADDARRLYRTIHETHPCAIVQDFHIQEFLQDYPDWQHAGITLFHLHTADPYPLGLLSRPAAVAFVEWERRRRYLTRAEAHNLMAAFGLSPAGKVSRNKVSVCNWKGRSCQVNSARKP
jgi:hypothetical protein